MITATKTKTHRKKPMYMTLTDFMRIQNEIIPSNAEYENRKALDIRLKTLSATKAKNWPDSLEMKKKNQLEYTKRKFLEDEKRRRKIDEEEHKYNEIQNNLVVNRAKNMLFEQQDAVKSFNSKLMYCDMLKERDYQKEIQNKKKEIENIIDKKYYDMELQKMEDYDKKELEKKLLNDQKRNERMKIISEQFQDAKIKRLQDYQEKLVEGQLMKIQAQKNLEEDKRKKEELERLKLEQRKNYLEANKLLEKMKEEKKQKELEEDKKIEEFAFKKRQMDDLRKKVEADKMNEKQAQRQKLIDKQIEYLNSINKKKEDELIEKNLKEKEEKKAREEKEKKDRFEKMQNEIKIQRDELIKKKEEEKNRIKKEDEQYIDDWKKKMKMIEMEERNELLAKKQRDKNLAKYQKLQLEEKKRLAKEHFMQLTQDSYKTKLGLEMETDEFLQYAEFWIKEYKKQGKNINPLLLELKKHKSNNHF